MTTDLLEIDQSAPSDDVIAQAAAAILRGQVIAIPTDGLYSLVADPFSLQAVGRVFAAKGREAGRSLPLLVSDVAMAEELCAEVSARFRLLARAFWPGPFSPGQLWGLRAEWRARGRTSLPRRWGRR